MKSSDCVIKHAGVYSTGLAMVVRIQNQSLFVLWGYSLQISLKKNDLWKDSMYYAKFIRLILPLQTDFSHILETQILHFQV